MPRESSQNETTPIEDDFTVKNYKPQEKTRKNNPPWPREDATNKRVVHQKLQIVEQSEILEGEGTEFSGTS